MKPGELRRLRQLARHCGVQTSYVDNHGIKQFASPEALLAVVRALGVPVRQIGDVSEARRHAGLHHWQRVLDPVTVAWDGKPATLRLRLPVQVSVTHFAVRLQFEDGRTKKWLFDVSPGVGVKRATVDGRTYGLVDFQLPPLPFGYHHLELESKLGRFHSLVLAAPSLTYAEPGRIWGLFLPLYALRSNRNWGAGNFGDWLEFSEWTAAAGGKLVGTLPLLAGFLGGPISEPSPYSPASRLFWNEFYLDIESVPEFALPEIQKLTQAAGFRQKLAQFRKSPFVDYQAQMSIRRGVLEHLARCLLSGSSDRRRQFNAFLREQPEVVDYARFRATGEQQGCSWFGWPERLRAGELRPGDFDSKSRDYHAYVQWLAREQMDAVTQRCEALGLKLYLDLPLGVHPDSYDVWRQRQAFALDANTGAPPDPFFSKGQNWGFSPLHPEQLRAQGYAYLLKYLRCQMRRAKVLRIDHVMSLHRLYWIPKGLPPTHGAYVRYPADELYAILSLESHRHQTMIVGENLGTVPPEVNRSMQRHGLRRMFVLQYEQRTDASHALNETPRQCVASLNTHDMPTFAGQWKGKDISDRAALGLLTKREMVEERQRRRKSNAALIQFLQRRGFLKRGKTPPALVLRACLNWLGASPAEMVLVNLEDLWLEEAPQNVPGTSQERPNWRRKTRLSLEAIKKDRRIAEILADLSKQRTKDRGARS